MSFAKEAWAFVLPPVGFALALLWFGRSKLAAAAILLALALLLFFRVPKRVSAAPAGSILAPANGRVTVVDVVEDAATGEGKFRRVATFLSVFDVHVQRSPVEGRVVRSKFVSGRKVAAFRDDAGAVNEQILTVLERDNGDLVGVRQIAGLVARRVVTYLEPADVVQRGEVIGVIKFGSRVDLLFPLRYDVEVEVGQRLLEGVSVVATDGASTNE